MGFTTGTSSPSLLLLVSPLVVVSCESQPSCELKFDFPLGVPSTVAFNTTSLLTTLSSTSLCLQVRRWSGLRRSLTQRSSSAFVAHGVSRARNIAPHGRFPVFYPPSHCKRFDAASDPFAATLLGHKAAAWLPHAVLYRQYHCHAHRSKVDKLMACRCIVDAYSKNFQRFEPQ